MRKTRYILLLILLASLMSLGSCVNELKTIPQKVQDTTAHDSLSQVAITFSIPDSNSLLIVKFHAEVTPSWKKYYRLDWTFGDGTGVISKFDTSGLDHYYRTFGSYIVTLSIFDTTTKTILGKTSLVMDLKNNAIDTNFLHGFTKFALYFSGQCNCIIGSDSSMKIVYDSTNPYYSDSYKIQWNGTRFQISGYYFTIGGIISYSGAKIDTGSILFENNSGWIAFGTHSFYLTFSLEYIDFHTLDQVFISTDSIVFSNKGSDLSSRITSLIDTAGKIVTTMPMPFSPSLQEKMSVDWNKQPPPFLRIKFYK